MYGITTYDSATTYLLGLDLGSGGGALAGFQELVELKFGRPSSVYWPGLVPQIDPPVDSDSDRLNRLFELLEEYLTVDGGLHGRRRLYHEWVILAQGTTSYRPEMERFGSSPEPATVSLDEAAALLGTNRRGVLERIRQRELRYGRIEGDVRVLKESLASSPDLTAVLDDER